MQSQKRKGVLRLIKLILLDYIFLFLEIFLLKPFLLVRWCLKIAKCLNLLRFYYKIFERKYGKKCINNFGRVFLLYSAFTSLVLRFIRSKSELCLEVFKILSFSRSSTCFKWVLKYHMNSFLVKSRCMKKYSIVFLFPTRSYNRKLEKNFRERPWKQKNCGRQKVSSFHSYTQYWLFEHYLGDCLR